MDGRPSNSFSRLMSYKSLASKSRANGDDRSALYGLIGGQQSKRVKLCLDQVSKRTYIVITNRAAHPSQ